MLFDGLALSAGREMLLLYSDDKKSSKEMFGVLHVPRVEQRS